MRLVLCMLLLGSSAGCRRAAHARASVPQPRAARAAATAPKEESGAKKWRDTGVYLDGRPIGVLSFGELPITLQPVWVKERVSTEIEPGSKSSGYRIVEQRRYRFTDYLRALGVDLRRIREIHVVGPRFSETIIASGAELRSPRGRELMFRFGGEVGGKAIPVVPNRFGNDMSPDKISAVMIYIDKPPPHLVPNEGLALNGVLLDNIPYYGEPLRGGVRVYQDDRLIFSIKRPLLRQTAPITTHAGVSRYALFDLLAAHGVDTSHVAEAWLISDERRTKRLSRDELEHATFTSGEKEKNEILIGDDEAHASAIALHRAVLRDDQLPKIRPEEGE